MTVMLCCGNSALGSHRLLCHSWKENVFDGRGYSTAGTVLKQTVKQLQASDRVFVSISSA